MGLSAARSTVRLLAALLLCVAAWAVAVAPAQAQTSEGLTVETNAASVEFGSQIMFQLRVRAGEPIRSVLLIYQVDDSTVENTGVPAYQPGTVVSATYNWRVANVLVPGAEVRYQWQVETASGRKTTTARQSVVYNDTRFNWREAQGDRVTVYWHSADAQTGSALLDESKKVQDRLSKDYGLTLDRPVKIYAYTRRQDFVSAIPSSQALGEVVTVGTDRIFVLAPGGTAGMTPALQGVRREMANVLFMQKTQNPYAEPPLWLSVGMVFFFSGDGLSDQNQQALASLAQNNRLIPLRTLNSNFPTREQDSTLAFAESISVSKYIADAYGSEKVRALLAAVKEGNTADDALKKGLGVTLDQLETRWKNALKTGKVNQPAPQGQVSTTTLNNPTMEAMFGPTVRFWEGYLGRFTVPVLVGAMGFMVIGLLSVVGGSIFMAVKRANAEE